MNGFVIIMGGKLSREDEEEIRGCNCYVRAVYNKRSHLEHEISKLKINRNYSRLNSQNRILKELLPYQKSLLTQIQETKAESKHLKTQGKKIHSIIASEKMDETLTLLARADTTTDLISEDISHKMSQKSLLKEKLEDLKKILQKKRKVFEKNKKKIEKIQMVSDLCHGRQKSLDIFQSSKDSNKIINRINSISTTESVRHAKHVSSIPIDFSGSELEIEGDLNRSMVIPCNKAKRVNKLKKARMLLILPPRTLYLRSKITLKMDLEKTVINNGRKLFKKFSQSKKLSLNLEKTLFALENNPDRYLVQLRQEEALIEFELDAERCKKDYYVSLNNEEHLIRETKSFVEPTGQFLALVN